MKPEELMIGDLVMHGFGGIGKITEIDSKTVVIKDDGFDTGDGMNEVSFALNEITPISLTDEILKKNFPSTTDWYFIGTDKFCFRIDKHKDKWDLYFGRDGKGTNLQIKISYVHELQHVMRLCGIDKEIEI